jgi:glycosyltransferase involved in cell wall biosynthesis
MSEVTAHPKRVLIFSLNYFPFVGGAEVALQEITNRIPLEEMEFHMVTSHGNANLPKVEQVGNVLVHRIGFARTGAGTEDLGRFPLQLNKYYFQIAAYLKATQLQKKYSYDAIWGMMAHSGGIPAGIFKKHFPEVKYLLTLQEGDPPEHIEMIMKPVWGLFKQGFTRADVLQSISTFLQHWGIRMGFRGNAKVIPNGVAVSLFSQEFSEEQHIEARAKFGKKEGEIFLVTTSRLVHKNAIDDVIRAVKLLPQNISFLIYGIGPDEAALRALAKECGVTDRVRFMGQISHGDMPNVFSACDIFVRPSRSEGMGNSFIEAMAARLPVIATQEGGIADFLFDAKRNPDKSTTGWAVDKNSPQQIADIVQEIIANPKKVRMVIDNATILAKEKYNWDLVAAEIKELFASLLTT